MAEDDKDKEFDAEGMGVKVHTRGYRFTDLVILIAFIAAGAFIFFAYQDMRQSRSELAVATKSDHDHIVRSIADLKGSINEQTYVLTLKQEDRERLRLDMPQSLRERIYYPPREERVR